MHPEIIDPEKMEILKTLRAGEKGDFLKDYYLAGGTAVALHLGHRISHDLDFFCSKSFDGRILQEKLSSLGKFEEDIVTKNNTIGSFNGTKISFMHFDSEISETPQKFEGVNVAPIKDLAAMKISAISQRGAKRDFIDLFYIMKNQNMNLADVMAHFTEKFKSSNPNLIHFLKSLTYFEDADKQNSPAMKTPVNWDEVKKFFLDKKNEFIKELENIGIEKNPITHPRGVNGPER
jgi:hypothetical protein